MKKIVSCILAVLLCFLTACESNDNNSSPDNRNNSKLTYIDVFNDVRMEYDGWNGCDIDIKIITDDCDNFIKENVKFHLTETYNQMYNGDMVSLIAEYDEDVFAKNNYDVTSNLKEYEIDGLKEIVEPLAFNEGVAWVKVRIKSSERWCCCDKVGNIIFVLDDGATPSTHFANGVAVVDRDKVVDKTGNIIWSVSQDGNAFIKDKWGESEQVDVYIYDYHLNSNEPVDYYGYTWVVFDVDSYSFTGEMVGLLDNKGAWILAPDVYGEDTIPFYRSDGIFSFESCLYDVVNNKFFLLYENDNGFHNFSADYAESSDFYISNYLSEHNGLYYLQGNIYNDNDEIQKSGFYNIDDEMIIDLSKYAMIYGEPEFNDGYALLDVYNEQGSLFYTIIDTNGKEMFEPKKNMPHKKLKCGYCWIDDFGFININGELAFNLPMNYRADFSDGMAPVYIINKNYDFVDSRYETLHYIDTDGNIIF